MISNSKEILTQQKQKYRTYVRNLPLVERLRHLESLQEQTYEILRIRELNGGRPIPRGWQVWAAAQNDPEIKK